MMVQSHKEERELRDEPVGKIWIEIRKYNFYCFIFQWGDYIVILVQNN